MIDLGSGDGTLVMEAAKRGAVVTGYEINIFLVWKSRVKIRRKNIRNANIKHKSLWKADVSQADVILLFGIPHMMARLENKLMRELPKGARVVSFTFAFPNWQPVKEKDNVRLYVKE